jgi:hypothetical protein
MLFGFSSHRRWRNKFQAAYPFFSSSPPDTNPLRLVLGMGRSGTSWVGKVLSKMTLPCRFLSEPLFHIHPLLPFHTKGDHTAVGYEPLSPDHPLLWAYRLLVHRQFDSMTLKTTEREDAGWEVCLVKEVHALLGSEGLLRALRCPTLFLLRDPLYVADSLFDAQDLSTIYLDHEVRAVRGPVFLERFVPGRREAVERLFADADRREPRLRTILNKVLCIQLMQEMFSVLAGEFPCARALRYESFCEAPVETFRIATSALSIPWDGAMEEYLTNTMRADATSADPYSIMRNTAEQTARPFKFLSAEETKACRSALQAIAA